MAIKEVEPDANNGRMERSAFRVWLPSAGTHPPACQLPGAQGTAALLSAARPTAVPGPILPGFCVSISPM